MLCAMNDERIEKIERLVAVTLSVLTILAFVLLPGRH